MNNCYNKNLDENMLKNTYQNNYKNKIDFYAFKKNTINSLNQVECFLNNYKQMIKCMKLYKLLK